MSNEELASTYASLALHDAGLAVSSAAISAMAKKAGVEMDGTFWPNFFERVLKTQSLDSIILNAGSVAAPSAAASTTSASTATATTETKTADKPAEKPKEPSSESEAADDGGLLDFF